MQVLTGIARETILLVDTTGSMKRPCAKGETTSRAALVRDILQTIVEHVGANQPPRSRGTDGVTTITFSDGSATHMGELTPINLPLQWEKLFWGGGTYIVPGFRLLSQLYQQTYGAIPLEERPMLRILVLTDGEPEDLDALSSMLPLMGKNIFVTFAVLGYGIEYELALRAYQRLTHLHRHIQVIGLTVPDSEPIAKQLLPLFS